jgi:RecJ-like exonuclease
MTVKIECPTCQGWGRIGDAECGRCSTFGVVEACRFCGERPADVFWAECCSARCQTERERITLGVDVDGEIAP